MSAGSLPRPGAPENPQVAHALAPSACPFCQDTRITTTSKSIGDATYWRCRKCGEIWNQSRLPAPRRRW
jgi:tRNA(Ile2) C34 agmatinyltransferase TiaS